MTAVVLMGDVPSTGFLRSTAATRVGAAGADGDVALIDVLAQRLADHPAVLALCPAWRATRALHSVRLARAALDSDRIGFLPLDLPPLALSLVADLTSWLSSRLRLGVAASVAERLTREVVAGAWVNSVTNLDRVSAGFGHHMSSYLPGSGFLVQAVPQPAVHRIGPSRKAPELPHRLAAPVYMLLAQQDGDTSWRPGDLGSAVAGAAITPVPAQPLGGEFWGTKKHAEFVAFSGHAAAVQNVVAAGRYGECQWCDEPTSLAVCPFCMMRQPDPRPGAAAGDWREFTVTPAVAAARQTAVAAQQTAAAPAAPPVTQSMSSRQKVLPAARLTRSQVHAEPAYSHDAPDQ